MLEIGEEKPFFLQPGEFVLGSMLECINALDSIVARLQGKCSLGRIGLMIHSTAGYVDPGWSGHPTLQLSYVAKLPITLYFRMRLGQVSFLRLSLAVEKPYGAQGLRSRYQGQTEPSPSRYCQGFKGNSTKG